MLVDQRLNNKNINLENLTLSHKNIDTNKITSTLCQPSFNSNDLLLSIRDCDFCLYVEEEKIVAILTVVIYENMWEINYICSEKKGSGTILINILKSIADKNKPVTQNYFREQPHQAKNSSAEFRRRRRIKLKYL